MIILSVIRLIDEKIKIHHAQQYANQVMAERRSRAEQAKKIW
jgi:hypothetical protein